MKSVEFQLYFVVWNASSFDLIIYLFSIYDLDQYRDTVISSDWKAVDFSKLFCKPDLLLYKGSLCPYIVQRIQ